eukprot:CAMPEP_0184689540 /NCGR_PEP_ID=MMETSP0312-20130426/30711_1 /TAXON_ID=31354 /ORGANISM="Compsopogon coeruleus, Strain SAG 36.94" /LENGTH=288 /DNA_ID=CAMNT_0027146901 /DNA_START=72 /DNA_END=938 /DNA_ORIENTATION=+
MVSAEAVLDSILSSSTRPLDHRNEVVEVLRASSLWNPSLVLRVIPRSTNRLRELVLLARATLELGQWEAFETLRKRLIRLVPRNGSVQCLCVGMRLEAKALWDRAAMYYVQLQDEHRGTNVRAYKRQVAVMKSQGLIPEALACVNDYLKFYPTDLAAWMEAMDLYISTQCYNKAFFCSCEHTLLAPTNWVGFCRAGDILYTMKGGKSELMRARHYYAKCILLSPDRNLRGLFGMWLTCIALKPLLKESKEALEENEQLRAWASRGIRFIYQTEKSLKAEKQVVEVFVQ